MKQETPSWSESANQLVNTWTETGTQMWQSWSALMGLVPPPSSASVRAQPEAKFVNQRLMDNQELFLRFFQLSFKAWQDIFPKVEAGENWQPVVNKYTKQIYQQLSEYSRATIGANQDTTELWKLYIKETQKFSQLWTASLETGLEPKQPLIEIDQLYWNLLYKESYGSLMQSPLLGPTRELSGKLLGAFDAWIQLYRADISYQVVLANVQIRSFEELMRKLILRSQKGEKIEDWRQFQKIWGYIADGVFEREFCSEDNLKIRGKFLNAVNTYNIHQQELMELWMKWLNVPVRSEVDEIHKNIYELRKEMKTLKKARSQFEAIDRENQELRQRVDRLHHSFDTLSREMETLKKDVVQSGITKPKNQLQAQ